MIRWILKKKKLFAALGATLIVANCQTGEEVIQFARDAIGIINSEIPITRKIIAALPQLKVIAKYSHGVDNIDVGGLQPVNL